MTPKEFAEQYEIQAKLIYSLICAGKSADFADRATGDFLAKVTLETPAGNAAGLPFMRIGGLNREKLKECAIKARTGNYEKISRACFDIATEINSCLLDLMKCTPADLERFHGIGPKTSRFFIIWCRPAEQYAALDVHVLRWMRNLGYDVPSATPQNKKRYAEIEKAFISEATKRGKTARQLDEEIWTAGAGRTQETALP